jgi:hypothetical protein
MQFSVISSNIINDDNVSNKSKICFKRSENFQPKRISKNLNSGMDNKNRILDTDTLIYGGFEESIIQNPTITDNNGQNVLIGFEYWFDWYNFPDPYFRFSNDGGMTWLPENSANGWGLSDAGYSTILPTIDFSGDGGAFGSVLPYGQNNWVTLNFPDIVNPDADDGWVSNGWIADVMMIEWDSVDVCGVNSLYAPSEDSLGIAIWTGDTIDGKDNGIWFGWEIEDGSSFTVYPETYYDFDADQAVNDIDLSSGKYYQAFLRFNDHSSNPVEDGVFLRSMQLDGTDEWVNDSWNDLLSIPDAFNPDIKADNGNCYLVYELNGGIKCHYSNDNGVTFNDVNIVDVGQYPSITAIDETVIVVYSRDGNVYNSISEDGGATWIESTESINDISGSVIEQLHCTDVSNNYIAWTDSRDTENSIYFDRAEVAIPIINIESTNGGVGVTTLIKNIGTKDANDIDWSISFDGGVIFGGDNSGTIDTLAVGESVQIKSKFLMGFGNTDITINVDGLTDSKSGKILLFFVIGL